MAPKTKIERNLSRLGLDCTCSVRPGSGGRDIIGSEAQFVAPTFSEVALCYFLGRVPGFCDSSTQWYWLVHTVGPWTQLRDQEICVTSTGAQATQVASDQSEVRLAAGG